jgi:30S ribosomal protein S31
MGKGDKKTRRGKLFQGSFGVRRPKNKTVAVPVAAKAVKVKEVKEVKEAKPVAAEVKAPKAAPAKKEPKPKKTEEPTAKHE